MTERSHNTGAGEPRVAEGPDVTLIAAALARWSGQTVTSIDVGPRCPSVMGVRDIVLPSTLRTVGCHGTSMWLDIDERILMVRIGQHTRVSAAIPDPRYAAITIHMSGGASVHINDHRRFVNVRVVDPATVRRYVSAAGPNVTSVTRADVQRITRTALSVDRTIAEALADTAVVAGVGQRIASEALYAARVSPWRAGHAVLQHEWCTVLDALHVESMRALSIGLAASAQEPLPSLAWSIPATVYGRTRLSDGTPLVRERCTSAWTLTWAPGVQT